MNRFISFIFLISSCFLIYCNNNNQSESGGNYPKGSEISLSWKLISNNYQSRGVYKSILTITNNSNRNLERNWELYFNHTIARKIFQDSLESEFKVIHINGDFYKIIPGEKFSSIKPGGSFDIPIVSNYVAIKYSDAPSGFYFIFKDESGKPSNPEVVIDYTIAPFQDSLIKRGTNDRIPLATPENVYKKNLELRLIPEKNLPLIIPTPRSITLNGDSLELDASYEIHY